jgi:hypothetical protein
MVTIKPPVKQAATKQNLIPNYPMGLVINNTLLGAVPDNTVT